MLFPFLTFFQFSICFVNKSIPIRLLVKLDAVPNDKIYLVGFMAAGKTTAAKALGARLAWAVTALKKTSTPTNGSSKHTSTRILFNQDHSVLKR